MTLRAFLSLGFVAAFALESFSKAADAGLPLSWPSQISDHYEETPEAGLAPPPPLATAAELPDLVDRPLGPTERLITLLGTNDIHGAIETDKQGKGGMALWGGIVQSIRQGLAKSHPGKAAVVLLDGGDQYQGTLISARTEGQTIIQQMRLIGYDGLVPGNHDYDFGPVDPPPIPGARPGDPPIRVLNDQVFGEVDRSNPQKDPRGVIRSRAIDLRGAALPRVAAPFDNIFVSANTFLSAGLFDTRGQPVKISDPRGCVPSVQGRVVDFTRSIRPNEGYILPFRILTNRAGLTIAVVGLDTSKTPETTNGNNISDLCFADEATAFLATRAQIEAEAGPRTFPHPDLYFIATHSGDSASGPSTFLQPLLTRLGATVNAVIAGHTHQSNRVVLGNVHAIQSGANGQHFGRIDLIYDTATRKVVAAQSANFIEFGTHSCDSKASRYCSFDGRTLKYENIPAVPMASVDALTRQIRVSLGTEPERPMGQTRVEVKPDRIRDSSLGEVFTDAMHAVVPGAQIAINNNGGLRTGFPAGMTITFDDLFRLMPFNNHLKRGLIPAQVLVDALKRAAQTCGEYPTLSFSGIVASYRRDCSKSNTTDPQAVLISASVGQISLVDPRNPNVVVPNTPAIDTLAPDFLADGGDGYLMFRGQPWQEIDASGNALKAGEVGGTVLREALAALGARNLINWNHPVDHRWRNINAQQDDVQ